MQENYSVDSWEKVKVIGRGGSSTVYRCVVRESGLSLAVKEIVTDGMTTDQIKGIGGEVDTIKNLSHDNIVRCFGSQQVANKLYIVLEFCGRGSLRKLYQDHGALSEPQAARCVLQILHGLEYLHANGVAHRDVKGANILLTSGGVLKLADFGASKKIETESLVSGLKGTPHWMAPEVIKGTQMSTGWMKADVWSLGCTLVEILSASLPFSEYDNPMTAMYQIASGKIPPLPPGASNEAASFVKDCCAADPEARPSVTALLTHPFLIQCRSLDGNQEYSLESSLFDGVSHARAVTVASKGVAEAGFPVADDIDVLTGEESYVDDDIEAVLSADVNRFMEERKAVGRVSQVGGLSVRTSSFHASDGEVAMVAPPLECEDTPVLHKSRKGIHTMSSNNILRVSDNPLTATTPAAGDSRRPPLQVSTERMSISTMSGGIAQHAGAVVEASVLSSCSRDAAIEDDVMDSVISPRLTSMTVSSTTNTPNVFFGKKRILSGGESLDGDLSRVSTANVMPLRAAAEIHSPAIGELKSNLPVYNHSEALSAPLPKFVLPTSEQVPSAVMFQIGRSDTVHTSHVTPVKRKHRPGKKNAQNHPSAKDYSVEIMSLNSDNSCAPSKHQLKVGTINISGPSAPLSHDNTQTPTTKTLGKVDHAPLLMREYPRNSEAGDASEGTSTEMVITASGGHKRKLKPTPPGSYGGAPHKVSANNRRNFAVATTSGVVPNSTIDLAKSSALPPIGTNQCLAGLTGKKREKNVRNF